MLFFAIIGFIMIFSDLALEGHPIVTPLWIGAVVTLVVAIVVSCTDIGLGEYKGDENNPYMNGKKRLPNDHRRWW